MSNSALHFRNAYNALSQGNYFAFSDEVKKMDNIKITDEPDVNAQNKDGQTPLHIAIATGCVQLSSSILQAGAHPNDQDKVFFIFFSQSFIFFHLWGFILYFYIFPIDIAVHNNDAKSLQLLINFGADPNVHCNKTPLVSTAVEKKYFEVLKILINGNAELNKVGHPPLITAIKEQNKEAAQILINGGADPSAMFEDQTIIQYAAKKKSPLYQMFLTPR